MQSFLKAGYSHGFQPNPFLTGNLEGRQGSLYNMYCIIHLIIELCSQNIVEKASCNKFKKEKELRERIKYSLFKILLFMKVKYRFF